MSKLKRFNKLKDKFYQCRAEAMRRNEHIFKMTGHGFYWCDKRNNTSVNHYVFTELYK